MIITTYKVLQSLVSWGTACHTWHMPHSDLAWLAGWRVEGGLLKYVNIQKVGGNNYVSYVLSKFLTNQFILLIPRVYKFNTICMSTHVPLSMNLFWGYIFFTFHALFFFQAYFHRKLQFCAYHSLIYAPLRVNVHISQMPVALQNFKQCLFQHVNAIWVFPLYLCKN